MTQLLAGLRMATTDDCSSSVCRGKAISEFVMRKVRHVAMKYVLFFIAFASVSAPNPAVADILTVVIDPGTLPYDLGPSKYENSPNTYENSSSNYENSAGSYDNSPNNYDNSPSNYANRFGGGRNLVTEDNKVIGYYVFSESGVINFYNYNSRRIAYLPSGGHTQSVFTDGGWCGTFGEIRGQLVLGISQSCYYAFILQN